LEKQIIGDMVSVRNQPSFGHCVKTQHLFWQAKEAIAVVDKQLVSQVHSVDDKMQAERRHAADQVAAAEGRLADRLVALDRRVDATDNRLRGNAREIHDIGQKQSVELSKLYQTSKAPGLPSKDAMSSAIADVRSRTESSVGVEPERQAHHRCVRRLAPLLRCISIIVMLCPGHKLRQ
jgi:hypothetical protein